MIINMISNNENTFPEGAYCPFGPGSYNDFKSNDNRSAKNPIVLYHTYKGLCLYEMERNGYNDSDFYMVVWDKENHKTKTILFATTRGWCYPCCRSSPDATPEVIAAYEKWKSREQRRLRISHKWLNRSKNIRESKEMNITRKQLHKLKASFTELSESEALAIIKLLKVKKFRSNFRKSCSQQIRSWLADPNPKYSSPLSHKQIKYIR